MLNVLLSFIKKFYILVLLTKGLVCFVLDPVDMNKLFSSKINEMSTANPTTEGSQDSLKPKNSSFSDLTTNIMKENESSNQLAGDKDRENALKSKDESKREFNSSLNSNNNLAHAPESKDMLLGLSPNDKMNAVTVVDIQIQNDSPGHKIIRASITDHQMLTKAGEKTTTYFTTVSHEKDADEVIEKVLKAKENEYQKSDLDREVSKQGILDIFSNDKDKNQYSSVSQISHEVVTETMAALTKNEASSSSGLSTLSTDNGGVFPENILNPFGDKSPDTLTDHGSTSLYSSNSSVSLSVLSDSTRQDSVSTDSASSTSLLGETTITTKSPESTTAENRFLNMFNFGSDDDGKAFWTTIPTSEGQEKVLVRIKTITVVESVTKLTDVEKSITTVDSQTTKDSNNFWDMFNMASSSSAYSNESSYRSDGGQLITEFNSSSISSASSSISSSLSSASSSISSEMSAASQNISSLADVSTTDQKNGLARLFENFNSETTTILKNIPDSSSYVLKTSTLSEINSDLFTTINLSSALSGHESTIVSYTDSLSGLLSTKSAVVSDMKIVSMENKSLSKQNELLVNSLSALSTIKSEKMSKIGLVNSMLKSVYSDNASIYQSVVKNDLETCETEKMKQLADLLASNSQELEKLKDLLEKLSDEDKNKSLKEKLSEWFKDMKKSDLSGSVNKSDFVIQNDPKAQKNKQNTEKMDSKLLDQNVKLENLNSVEMLRGKNQKPENNLASNSLINPNNDRDFVDQYRKSNFANSESECAKNSDNKITTQSYSSGYSTLESNTSSSQSNNTKTDIIELKKELENVHKEFDVTIKKLAEKINASSNQQPKVLNNKNEKECMEESIENARKLISELLKSIAEANDEIFEAKKAQIENATFYDGKKERSRLGAIADAIRDIIPGMQPSQSKTHISTISSTFSSLSSSITSNSSNSQTNPVDGMTLSDSMLNTNQQSNITTAPSTPISSLTIPSASEKNNSASVSSKENYSRDLTDSDISDIEENSKNVKISTKAILQSFFFGSIPDANSKTEYQTQSSLPSSTKSEGLIKNVFNVLNNLPGADKSSALLTSLSDTFLNTSYSSHHTTLSTNLAGVLEAQSNSNRNFDGESGSPLNFTDNGESKSGRNSQDISATVKKTSISKIKLGMESLEHDSNQVMVEGDFKANKDGSSDGKKFKFIGYVEPQ